MKRNIYIYYLLIAGIIASCTEPLDLRPLDKVDAEALFATPAGVKAYMANLYYQMPVEDFAYCPFKGSRFNFHGNNNGKFMPYSTDLAVHSQANVGGFYHGSQEHKWWGSGYQLLRDVNLLINTLPTLDLNEEDFKNYMGEAYFIRAYTFLALARRYGGISLITELQTYEGDPEALKVPRSTEKETWDQVLSDCDKAIENLPEIWSGDQERRPTKWAAYALKSRAALHAASIAKYWNEAPLSGEAVSLGLVGMDASEANRYYEECIEASGAIMNSGVFSLYSPSPGSPEEAAENYRSMFETPSVAKSEVIFLKGYSIQGLGHSYDFWFQPNQTAAGAPHPGRMNPTLELVDSYESYSNPGYSSPVVTTEDGDVNNYIGFSSSRNYLRFDKPYDIFVDKDARLWGTVILPGTVWKGTEIVIQGGYVKPDGEAVIETKASIEVNGMTYYTFGAADNTGYSGFENLQGKMTKSGFGFKKFLSQVDLPGELRSSTTDWIDMRFAEVLLNYAEAVVESGYSQNNAQAKAAKAINDIRRRAAHTVDIPLSIENVLRERKIELAFENKRTWDLVRRREYHSQLHGKMRHALMPLLDLRVNPPKYIFVRRDPAREKYRTFEVKEYYRPIPDVTASGLVQNPEW